MNYSNLPVYYSKENLTTRFIDNSNVYLLPSICLFGIITSLICILVSFKRDESNSKTQDYIWINSMIDFLFLLIEFFLFIIRCGSLCPFGYSYGAKFYEIYIYLYIGYILMSSQVFLSLYVSIERLRIFSGKLVVQKNKNLFFVYNICLLISILANALPYLIAKEITPLGILYSNDSSFEILYMRATRKNFQTPVFKHLLTACLVIKDLVMYMTLLVVNIWVCLEFRKFLDIKNKLINRYLSNLKI